MSRKPFIQKTGHSRSDREADAIRKIEEAKKHLGRANAADCSMRGITSLVQASAAAQSAVTSILDFGYQTGKGRRSRIFGVAHKVRVKVNQAVGRFGQRCRIDNK